MKEAKNLKDLTPKDLGEIYGKYQLGTLIFWKNLFTNPKGILICLLIFGFLIAFFAFFGWISELLF